MEPIPEVVWCELLLDGRFEFFDDAQRPVATAWPDEDLWPNEFAVTGPGDRPWFRLVRNTGWGHTYELVLPEDDLLATLTDESGRLTLTLGDGDELDVRVRNLGDENEFFDDETLLAHVSRRRAPGRKHLDPLARRVSFWDRTPTTRRRAILGAVVALVLLRSEQVKFIIRNTP
ncbi:MAG: hypothetical protein Q4D89_12755 [Arachnia propionica]|uniref:hypothetical protein n=1 Tax=Arachnia propionica TaxID=1750 RepID=UPI0027019F17|nr:hypothetical protein [Arachnia propionica]